MEGFGDAGRWRLVRQPVRPALIYAWKGDVSRHDELRRFHEHYWPITVGVRRQVLNHVVDGLSDRLMRVNPSSGSSRAPLWDRNIADALRRDFGDTPTHVKHISRLTGANARTVQTWLQARNGRNGAGFAVLMRHSDLNTTAVLALAERN